MDQKSYPLGGILLLAIGLVSGCASAQAMPTSDDVVPEDAIEMVVLNRTASTVTVFVQWGSGTRIRLGEVGGRTTKTFTTPHRDTRVGLSVDVLGSPSRGTTRGGRAFGGASPRARALLGSDGGGRAAFFDVDPGDRYEWVIRVVIPSVDMFFQRIGPQ